MTDDVPDDVVEDARRLTRLAREAVDEGEASAYRTDRDELVAEYDYTARVREEDTNEVLVLYPGEWVEDGEVRFDRIEDTSRAVEVSLSGAGDAGDWKAVDEHNREVAAAVREAYGDVHGDNADALADFMSNHYAKRIEEATAAELEEFLDEYFVRNAWPSDQQKSVVTESVRLVYEETDRRFPELSR